MDPKQDCCSQRITIPNRSAASSKKRYQPNAKPVEDELDVAYALDKLENLIVSFMTDYINSLQIQAMNRNANPLLYNVRRKFQLMNHLLRQFHPKIQLQLQEQVLSELFQLIEGQRDGLRVSARKLLKTARDLLLQFKTELEERLPAVHPHQAHFRTLRIAKFIYKVKNSLGVGTNPAESGQVEKLFLSGRGIAPPYGHGVKSPVTALDTNSYYYSTQQPLATSVSFTKLFEEVRELPKVDNGNVTKPLDVAINPQNTDTSFYSYIQENSAKRSTAPYTNMMVRQNGGFETKPKPSGRSSSLSCAPFIWCGIGPSPPPVPLPIIIPDEPSVSVKPNSATTSEGYLSASDEKVLSDNGTSPHPEIANLRHSRSKEKSRPSTTSRGQSASYLTKDVPATDPHPTTITNQAKTDSPAILQKDAPESAKLCRSVSRKKFGMEVKAPPTDSTKVVGSLPFPGTSKGLNMLQGYTENLRTNNSPTGNRLPLDFRGRMRLPGKLSVAPSRTAVTASESAVLQEYTDIFNQLPKFTPKPNPLDTSQMKRSKHRYFIDSDEET